MKAKISNQRIIKTQKAVEISTEINTYNKKGYL